MKTFKNKSSFFLICSLLVIQVFGQQDNNVSSFHSEKTILNSDKALERNTSLDVSRNLALTNGILTVKGGTILYVNASVLTKDLVVDTNGNVLVKAGKTITVQDGITNNGTITIENTASLKQITEIDTNTGAGIFKVQKSTGGYFNYDYLYFSSPVQNTTLGSVFPLASGFPNYRYSYNPQNFLDIKKGPGYPQTDATSGDGYDDDGNDWTKLTDAFVMPKGLGFIVMGKNSVFPFSIANAANPIGGFNLEFSANKVNNGSFDVNVYQDAYSPSFNALNNNQNLLGNPYPSAIDVFELYHDNAAVLDGNFYFWTHDRKIAAISGPNTYDFSNLSFAIGSIIGTYPDYTYTSINSTAKRYIASGQGFVASVRDGLANPSTVTFKNSMRLVGDNNTFLRQNNQTVPTSRVWLNMTGANDVFRQIAIGFDATTSDAYGSGDAPRIEGADDTDLYSLIPGDNGHYAIQFLSEFNENKIVPLGIEVLQSGIFQIGIDQMDGIFSTGQKVYLQDNEANIIYDLSLGAYSFSQTAGTNINDRFVLRFTSGALGIDTNTIENLVVYPNPSKGKFYLNYSGASLLQILVYDLTGKQLIGKTATNSGATHYTIDLSGYQTGIYLAKITSEGKTVTKKLVVE